MDTSEYIICPSITVWSIFIINIFFNYISMITVGINIFQYNSYGYNRYGELMPYYRFIFSSLLINFLIELVASILVSLSFEKKNKRFYIIGLIMTLVFAIYMTVYFIITWVQDYKSISLRYRDQMKVPLALNRIIQILIEWSKFGVLMLYFNKIKSAFNNSESSQGLISDFPNQIQPNE